MASTLSLKYKNSYNYTKINTQPNRAKYHVWKIEYGLSPNLAKKLLQGVSISTEMINIEISKNNQLKETIKKLKKDLKILKIIRGKNY